MKKKLMASVIAILCVMGSSTAIQDTFQSDMTSSLTAIAAGTTPASTTTAKKAATTTVKAAAKTTAKAAATTPATTTAAATSVSSSAGKYASKYKNKYADTSIYTYKIKAVSNTQTKIDGNVYDIYQIDISHMDNTGSSPKSVKDVTYYRLGLTTANSTTLDYTFSDIELSDKAKAYIENNKLEKQIPDTKVRLIANGAFKGSYLKSIDLSGIEYIDSNAFANCPYITEIEIPSSVIYVGTNTFQNSGLKTLNVNCQLPVIPSYFCAKTKLTEINFSNPEMIREIGANAFEATPLSEPLFNSFGEAKDYETLSVDDNAYKGCTSIKSVVMSDNVRTLAKEVFYGCTNLRTVQFGKNTIYADEGSFEGCTALDTIKFNSVLEALGGGCFRGCTGLKEVKGFPDTIEDWVAYSANTGYGFGNYMFQNCTALVSCDLPKSITRVPEGVFSGCTSLKTVYNGENITAIDKEAFMGCTNLLEAVYPEVTKIGESAFKNCSKLITFKVGKCSTVGKNAMEGCSSLKTITLLSDEYGDADNSYVFKNCTSAEKITVSLGKYTQLPKGLFSGCSKLKTVDGDLSKISISGKETFSGCTALESINLPALRIIEDKAFYNCTNLKSISDSSNAIAAEDYGTSCFENCTNLKAEVTGTISTIGTSAFKKSGITKVNIDGMKGGTVVIGNNAFSDCPNLKDATIKSKSAETFSIGNAIFQNSPVLASAVFEGPSITQNMFYNCPALATVTTNATDIQSGAFQKDVKLTKLISLADNTKTVVAKSVGANAFNGCSTLTGTHCDSKTTFTGASQYAGCTSIKSASLGALTQGMFKDCSSLASVTLSNVTIIPDYTFQNCSALNKLDLANIISIGASAFENTGFETVKTETAQSIGQNAFTKCQNLKSVDIAAATIGSNAFSNCPVLEDAVIYASTIGSSAFANNSILSTVTLQSNKERTLEKIDSNAFANDPKLYEIVIPGSPVIGAKAIGYKKNAVDPVFLIAGETGSSSHTYATENNIAFCDVKDFDLSARQNSRKTPGDIDGNSVISVADAVKLQSWLFNKSIEDYVPENMDVNSDGKVNTLDMVSIRQKLAKTK